MFNFFYASTSTSGLSVSEMESLNGLYGWSNTLAEFPCSPSVGVEFLSQAARSSYSRAFCPSEGELIFSGQNWDWVRSLLSTAEELADSQLFYFAHRSDLVEFRESSNGPYTRVLKKHTKEVLDLATRARWGYSERTLPDRSGTYILIFVPENKDPQEIADSFSVVS